MNPMTQMQDSHGTTRLKSLWRGEGAKAAESKIFILNVQKYHKIIF
jgi:hypothetical protein